MKKDWVKNSFYLLEISASRWLILRASVDDGLQNMGCAASLCRLEANVGRH